MQMPLGAWPRLPLSIVVATGCATTPRPATSPRRSLARPSFRRFRLVADAGLSDTLRGPGPYTVFAPSNDAFAAPPATDDVARQRQREAEGGA